MSVDKDKYIHQRRYSERNKEKIALYCKKRYLNKHIEDALSTPVIMNFGNKALLDEATDWYLSLDSTQIRGYKVTAKFKTIVFLLMAYKYRIPVFFQEFEIDPPVKRTQGLKEKLVREYKRIYKTELQVIHLRPLEYLPRFVDKFNIPNEMEEKISNLLAKTYRYFEFTNPKTYIASVVYHIMKGFITQKQLAEFLRITPNGIRGVHRKLKEIIQRYHFS